MSSQKTRHQKLNSYWVMVSLGDQYLSPQQRYPPQSFKYKDIYACIINIYVPHEVKNPRALAERTSRIMKYGQDVATQKGQMLNIQLSLDINKFHIMLT